MVLTIPNNSESLNFLDFWIIIIFKSNLILIMQIPAGMYPDYATLTTLEGLTLKLAREVLAIQKNPTYNSGVIDLINLTADEEKEVISFSCDNWEAILEEGEFTVKNYFPSHTFAPGTGDYPFNQTHLCDALFHAVVFQQLQELNLLKNPGDGNQLCSFSATSTATKGRILNWDISFSVTDLPTTLIQVADGTTTKARSYLQDI